MVAYLKHEYFARGAINVEFAIRWIIGIDALSREEVDNILWAILVAIRCGDLYSFHCSAVLQKRDDKINGNISTQLKGNK